MSLAEMRVKIRTPVGLLLVLAIGGRFALDTFEEARVILENLPSLLRFLSRPVLSLLLLFVGLGLIFWELNDIRRTSGEPTKRHLRHYVFNSIASFNFLLVIVGLAGGSYALYAHFGKSKPQAVVAINVPLQESSPPNTVPPIPNTEKPKAKLTPTKPSQQSAPAAQQSPAIQNCPGGICAGGDISGSPTIVNPGPPPPTITTCVSEPQVVNVATGETRQVYTMTTSAEVTGPTYGFQFSGNILAKGTTSGSPDMAMNMREAVNGPNTFAFQLMQTWFPGQPYKC